MFMISLDFLKNANKNTLFWKKKKLLKENLSIHS